jgi:hypothetical protein
MWACFSHSSAHAVQVSAHSLTTCLAGSDPLERNEMATWQISAESISSFMDLANIMTPFSFKHASKAMVALCRNIYTVHPLTSGFFRDSFFYILICE